MARAYSRSKGKAKSTRPSERKVPQWQSYKPAEVEALIVKLAKEGKPASQIGLILRDSYGVPDVKTAVKKTVSAVLKEKNAAPKLPEDLAALLRRVISLQKHAEKNKQDMTAKRGLQLTEAKVMKLLKYYKAKNVLPATWKYDRSNVQLLLK